MFKKKYRINLPRKIRKLSNFTQDSDDVIRFIIKYLTFSLLQLNVTKDKNFHILFNSVHSLFETFYSLNTKMWETIST